MSRITSSNTTGWDLYWRQSERVASTPSASSAVSLICKADSSCPARRMQRARQLATVTSLLSLKSSLRLSLSPKPTTDAKFLPNFKIEAAKPSS
eukprot:CAMPEP_0174720302 /NCGR_PEP_ID=MMETSP1094-20130205/33246_1 /TAXON_ID=156173 /ORGANISM="Chrysochromulina brevifilum, Strain UTEX LB 985" /LENGTH=93 /DNA_ID=CAMNT_0015920767 /DNA_START=1224 /DNA_END=1502 /DNA_ORIENTATION=+